MSRIEGTTMKAIAMANRFKANSACRQEPVPAQTARGMIEISAASTAASFRKVSTWR